MSLRWLINPTSPLTTGPDEWPELLKLEYEREMLGLYVSGHPLDSWQHEMDAEGWATLGQVLDAEPADLPDRTPVTICGMFTGLHRRSRGKSIWLVGQFEDQHRFVEVQAWGDVWAKIRWLSNLQPVVVDAAVRRSDDRPLSLALLDARRLERHPPGCLCEPPQDEPEPQDPPEMTNHLRGVVAELQDWKAFAA